MKLPRRENLVEMYIEQGYSRRKAIELMKQLVREVRRLDKREQRLSRKVRENEVAVDFNDLDQYRF